MKRKTARCVIVLLLLMTVSGAFSGCRRNADITSADQLNRRGIKVGVATDTTEFALVKKYYPKAELVYFKDDLAAYTSVAQGKVDAYVYNWVSMHTAILNGLKGVRLLGETVGEGNKGAAAISPKARIPDLKDRIDEFLGEIKADGTLADMEKRWILENKGKMPDIPGPEDPELKLIVGTTGSNAPFTYYEGTKLAGYDVELAKRFASWLGADLEFRIYDYDGIVAAAQAGDVDCIFADLYVTPEREKEIQFSEPTYISQVGIMVRDTSAPEYTSLSDFSGKRIGAVTGAIQGPMVEKQIPSAEISYFNNHADLLNALKQGKIDGYADSDLMIRYQMIYNPDLTYLDEKLADPVDAGVIFAKNERGDKIRAEFNEYLKKQKADGKLKEKEDLWFSEDESVKKVKDPSGLPAKNGTLKLATYASVPPFTYVSDNQIVGMDIDIATGFCEEYGYGLEIVDMSFDGLITAIAAEKFDFGIGCIAITEERAESVNFSDPVYQGNSVIAYLDDSGSGGNVSFLASLKDSFEKTFIRENRWKLFLAGIGTTLLITVMSILAGTLLGFLVFMACRNGNRIANKITRFSVWLIQGMPVVVLLMILYYIVFSNVGIPGAAVSVVAFTLIFASAVYSMLVNGVSAVDKGQTEAAYSLGYTDRRAFYRVVLPQALPLIMPVYKAQITALIKATAVVGYVAVQDLTKMGDIVRSRTYEAFFPLVSVAVMYFVLAAILTRIVEKIEISVDPKQKKKKLSDIPDE